jgi:hypothetical protein
MHRDGKEGGPKRTGNDVGVEACVWREVAAAGSILTRVPSPIPTIKCKTLTYKNSVYPCVGLYLVHPALQLQSD